MKLAMQAPPADVSPPEPADAHRAMALDTSQRQVKVWASVRRMQNNLTASTGADVRVAASQSSLQLASENEKLAMMRAAYIGAL